MVTSPLPLPGRASDPERTWPGITVGTRSHWSQQGMNKGTAYDVADLADLADLDDDLALSVPDRILLKNKSISC